MAIDGGKILAYLELDTSGYQDAMTSAHNMMLTLQDSSVGLGAKLDSLGTLFQTAGSKLTLGLTTPLLAAGTAAAKAAVDFESAFAGVRKTVDATEEEYAALEEGIKALSEVIPQSASELAGIAEIAGQLGVDQSSLLSFTETIANLGVSTNLTGEEAATMLAQYANIMQMPLSDIERLGSVIVDLGNHCATTEADITEMAQRLAGTGSLLGLTNAQVMGLSATMSSLGVEAEAGGSAMSRTLQTMNSAALSGGEALESFADIAGMAAQDFAQAFQTDPMEALEAFLEGLGRINESGGDAAGALEEVSLSDLRITDTLLRMASAQGSLTENISLASAAWDENTALQTEASKRYETTESQLQLAKNSITNMASSLGDLLLPAVTQGAEAIGQAADGIASLDEGTKSFVVTAGAAVAAIGPVTTILGTLLKTVSSPVGLVVALGLAGAAGVKAIRDIRQADLDARLAERFGDIALSAQEMDEIIDGLFAAPRQEHLTLSVLLDDAQADLEQAVSTFESQQLTVNKMMIQAEMGLEVDGDELTKAAAQLALDASAAIEAQQVTASLAVDAVFGADDPEGEKLREKFTAYFSQADATALEKGVELSAAIEKGMQDGFLDEVEQETIDALRQEIAEITSRATSIDKQAAMLKFQVEAGSVELDPASLTGLQERANEAVQAGIDEMQQNGEQLETAIYLTAAAEGWTTEEIQQELDAVEAQVDDNIAAWEQDSYTKVWQSIGERITDGFAAEMESAGDLLGPAMQSAVQDAYSYAERMGIAPEGDYLSLQISENLRDQLGYVGWDDIVTPQVRQEAQAMYESLMPMQETLREMAQAAGDDFPQELQEALDQLDLLEMLSMDTLALGSFLGQALAAGADDAQGAGEDVADSAVTGLETAEEGAKEAGDNAGAGFVSTAGGYITRAYQAGYSVARSYVQGSQSGLDAHSPSRETAKLAGWAVEGFVGTLESRRGDAYEAGYAMARAAVTGVQEGQDSHSPSKVMIALGNDGAAGYIEGYTSTITQSKAALKAITAGQAAEAGAAAQEADEASAKKRASASASRAKAAAEAEAAAAAAAEAARQKAVLDGIQQTAAATLAADTAAFDSRMGQIAEQTQALMDFAGAHAIWYQDDKGETQTQAVKDYYNALIAEEKARYEAQAASLSTDAQKKAAKEAYDERIALLKSQMAEETAAIQKQYSLQQQMAEDWLTSQKTLLQEEMSAKRAAYEEEDYQDELAALQKKLRQSKSAREQRELQEQIDKMIRDHELEQEEAAMQETLAGYDALIEAVQAGLIGLGDLTGNSAFGDLSFGTAGLTALDNITASQMEAVLRSLSQNSLTSGTAATVTAAQMAAALSSASQTTSMTTTQSGSTYNINLSGAVIRDDSDITRIVEELEKKIREAAR